MFLYFNPFYDSNEKYNYSILWNEKNNYCFTYEAFGYQWVYNILSLSEKEEKGKDFWSNLINRNGKSSLVNVTPDIVIFLCPENFFIFPGKRIYEKIDPKVIEKTCYKILSEIDKTKSYISEYNKNIICFKSYRYFTKELFDSEVK